jgi:hypothetical protein
MEGLAMGITFDHVQYVVDLRLMLGETTSEISRTSPVTDDEVYRCVVDAGFSGTVTALEYDIRFERYSSVSQSVSWKWEVRGAGQSSWLAVATGAETWGGYATTEKKVFVDAAALGAHAVVPFEMRMIVTAASAATVKVRIGTQVPSVRVFGVSA